MSPEAETLRGKNTTHLVDNTGLGAAVIRNLYKEICELYKSSQTYKQIIAQTGSTYAARC